MTINYIYTCGSDTGYTIWHGILLGYKGIIQVVAILLAFGTRKVTVKGLNDSKYIAAIIYVTSICLVMIIISFAALGDRVNALAVIFSFGFWCVATTILLLVFLPKVPHPSAHVYTLTTMILFTQFYAIYKDPKGEEIFPTTIHCKNAETSNDIIATLERQIHELKKQLASRVSMYTIIICFFY